VGIYLHMKGALPGVAAYALVAPLVMVGAAKLFHKGAHRAPLAET
jgi:hypothetical protein